MNAETATQIAAAHYSKDRMFRAYVDAAVHEAMRHLDHVHDEIEPRDVHHVAVSAAMAALRLAMERDDMLQRVTAERDQYKAMAEKALSFTPPQPFIFNPREVP